MIAAYEKLLDRLQDPLLAVIRLVWGIPFCTLGLAKLTNLGQTSENFAGFGIPLPFPNAIAAGLTECLGGLCLAAGFQARLAALPLVVVMLVAYFTAHPGETFTAAKPFPFLAASAVVLVFGPGRWSLDHWRRGKTDGSD